MVIICQHFGLTLIWILLFIILENSPQEKNFGCNAQTQNQRFFINFGADFAEIFSHFPTSRLPGIINPILKRTQNQLVANRPFGLSGRSILSNNPRRIRFLVYNDKRNLDSFFELDLDHPSTIPALRIRNDNQVKILIHGFNSNYGKRFPQGAKNAYLRTTDNMVIAVDWSDLATPAAASPIKEILYFSVADNVSRVGLRIYHLIAFLMQNQIISNLRQVHLVGHSLGGHVAAHTGQLIQQRYGAKVGRITGLDVAGPLFRSGGDSMVLDKSDAEFVDIIHTSPTGIYSPIGDVDFYPNGGLIQPHCIGGKNGKLAECNHLSAYDYFTKSIYQTNIVACGCNTYQEFRIFCKRSCTNRAIMGEYVSTRARGKYFLDIDL